MKSQKCTAVTSRDHEPCKNWAIVGGTVCRFHGGSAPQVKAAAARKIREEKTINSLRDIAPMSSIAEVYEELLAVAGTARAWRELLQQRVSALTDLGYRSATMDMDQLRADVQLFERAMDRSARVGEIIARLNLEERKQALDERTAAQVSGVITAILNDLQLTTEQKATAKRVAPARLRELTA